MKKKRHSVAFKGFCKCCICDMYVCMYVNPGEMVSVITWLDNDL